LSFFAIFWIGRKLSLLDNLKSLNQATFSCQKNNKNKNKNIKFDFLQEFDIENKLNSLDQLFLI
jgi:hypothetical protein